MAPVLAEIGAEHDVDIRIRQQNRTHHRRAAGFIHRQRRNIRDDDDARQILERIAHGDKAGRQELQAVMSQQNNLGPAIEAGADIRRRFVPQHFAGQVLRSIQHGGRGRRHHGADIGP